MKNQISNVHDRQLIMIFYQEKKPTKQQRVSPLATLVATPRRGICMAAIAMGVVHPRSLAVKWKGTAIPIHHALVAYCASQVDVQ